MPDENPDTVEPIVADATELAAVRSKLTATELELNNYKLKLADFDNARKRMLRDAEVERKYATEPLARDLLAALDNLDRALQAAKRFWPHVGARMDVRRHALKLCPEPIIVHVRLDPAFPKHLLQ